MNPGATSERVHEQIKDLLIGDTLRPGARLDPAVLARKLAASTTPVREALNRLAGEGVVDTQTSGGFFVPLANEAGVHHLYGWSGDIVAVALGRLSSPIKHAEVDELSHDFATRIARLLAEIAGASSNCEHRRAMLQANLRLHAIRLGEVTLFPNHDRELEEMQSAATQEDVAALRRLTRTYHRRRQRMAGELVRLRYRNSY